MIKSLKFYSFGLIFLIAFALRFNAYFSNNSFFTDEVLLASNILDRNYLNLIFPLNFFQSAPYLFLALTKFLVNLFGYCELVFRFVPFISSIFSVILFYFLCDLIFKKTWSKIIALITFSTNYQLLFYSQAFKQYSTDVFWVILTLFLLFKYFQKLDMFKHFTALGLYSFLTLFCSFPLFMIFPAVYISLLIIKPKKVLLILYSSLFYFLSAGIYYCFNLRFVKENSHLLNYWQKGFDIWNINLYQMNFDFLFFYEHFSFLLGILLIIGFYKLFKENKFYFTVFFLIICLTLFFAFLKIYPFERRLILFLSPLIILVSVYPLDFLKKNISSLFILLISGLFFFTGYFNFSKDLFTGKLNYLRQDVKPLLNVISDENGNNKVYLYYSSIYVYNYYSLFKNLPRENVIFGTYPIDENNSEKYLIEDLLNLSKGEYFLLFVKGTNTYNKDIEIVENWIKNKNIVVKKDFILKSTRLIKLKI